MRVLVFFFGLVLASSTQAKGLVEEKNAIDDALALKECLEQSLPVIENTIKDLVAAVDTIRVIITTGQSGINKCLAIGGANPSIPQQIEEAVCFVNLIASLSKQVPEAITEIKNLIPELTEAGAAISKCFG